MGRGTSNVSVVQTATPQGAFAVPASSGPSPAVPDVVAAPAVAAPAAAVPAARGDSSGRSGASRASASVGIPPVVFGDGRSPGLPSGRPDELPGPLNVAQAPVAPAPAAPVSFVPAPVAPFLVLTLAPAPVPRTKWSLDTPVTSLWGRVQPGWPAVVIFGIAGLLLVPIGGIWLGHRQAHASRAASKLISR